MNKLDDELERQTADDFDKNFQMTNYWQNEDIKTHKLIEEIKRLIKHSKGGKNE